MTFEEWFKGYEKEHNKYSSLSNNLSKHDLKQAWNAAIDSVLANMEPLISYSGCFDPEYEIKYDLSSMKC